MSELASPAFNTASAHQLARYDGRPRLLGNFAGHPVSITEHVAAHGPLPFPSVPGLIEMVGAAGLRGLRLGFVVMFFHSHLERS